MGIAASVYRYECLRPASVHRSVWRPPGRDTNTRLRLLEEAGSGVVGQDLAAGLAGRAVGNGVPAVRDRADRVATHGASLADAPVDATGSILRRAHVGASAFVGEAFVDCLADRGD